MFFDQAAVSPAFIDTSLEARAANFENSTGARGSGGSSYGGRSLAERVDDVCSTAFVYCTTPQAVRPVDPVLATADIGLLDYEPRVQVVLTGALIDLIEAGALPSPG